MKEGLSAPEWLLGLRDLRGFLGEESSEEALCLACCHTDEGGGEDLPDGEYIGDVLAELTELTMGRVSSTSADEALMAGGLIAELIEDRADDGDGRGVVDRLSTSIGGDQLGAVVTEVSQVTYDLGEGLILQEERLIASLLEDEVRAALVHGAGGTIVALLTEVGDEVETYVQTLRLSEYAAGDDVTHDLSDQGAQEDYQQDKPEVASCQIEEAYRRGFATPCAERKAQSDIQREEEEEEKKSNQHPEDDLRGATGYRSTQ